MKLIDWMSQDNKDPLDVAQALGVSVFAVRKWLRSERIPRPAMQSKIKAMTNGLVCGDDWLDAAKDIRHKDDDIDFS